MTELGTLIDRRAVRFERFLPGPIERVWDFLSDGKRLPTWFYAGSIEPRVGGVVHFENGVDGHVTAYEPPNLLEYTWNEVDAPCGEIANALVRWELSTVGERVRLVLIHSRVPEPVVTMLGAGWHTFLDRLDARLADRDPGAIATAYAALKPTYEAHFVQTEQR